jgi:hypothetical protein
MTNSMRVSTQRPLLRGHQRRDVCKGNLRRSFNDRRRRLGADEHGNPQHRRGKETSLRYRVDPEVDLASALSIIEGVLECVRVKPMMRGVTRDVLNGLAFHVTTGNPIGSEMPSAAALAAAVG